MVDGTLFLHLLRIFVIFMNLKESNKSKNSISCYHHFDFLKEKNERGRGRKQTKQTSMQCWKILINGSSEIELNEAGTFLSREGRFPPQCAQQYLFEFAQINSAQLYSQWNLGKKRQICFASLWSCSNSVVSFLKSSQAASSVISSSFFLPLVLKPHSKAICAAPFRRFGNFR